MIDFSRGDLMNNNFKNLLNEFEKIKLKGWIRSNTKSTGAIGITFEKELGLFENNSYHPDFNDIEIKCTNRKAIYPLTLFSISFDGPGTRELLRIVELYGYPDKIFKKQKVLYANLSCKHLHRVYSNYYFKLELNRNEEKIYLVIYDINKNIIDKTSYIYFNTIKNHLITKMRNLAFIHGDRLLKDNILYFKYIDIFLYTLKDFDVFLNLLENDDITANVGYRINKSIRHFGKSSSKNIVFTIAHSKITKLFDKIN